MTSYGILASLRKQTMAEHQALESSLNLMDENLTTADYVRTLRRFHAFVCTWEADAAAACPHALQAFFEQRRRAHHLCEDLRFFGGDPLMEIPELPSISSAAAFWGTMYVMEGSTLGGQLISRHLERVLDLRDEIGYRYFRGYGAQTGSMWKDFCMTLSHAAEELDSAEVISSARQTFQAFHAWIRS